MSSPHIYVIHLKERKDRKTQFRKAWATVGNTEHLHWFPAVLGAALPDSTLAAFRTAARTRKARAGRVGCYCSHVAAIETAIKKDHFPLLVLEDDAIPNNPTASLATLFDAAPKTATLLYFGGSAVVGKRRNKTYCAARGRWSPIPLGTSFYGAYAYGIRTRAAAEELVAHLKSNKMTYDSALIRYQKTNRSQVSVYCPYPIGHAAGYSDIEDTDRPAQ